MAEKKSPKKQPTQRTLDECRKRGWLAGIVERWKPGMRDDRETGEKKLLPYGTRVDFLGFADIMVLDGQPGYLAINACVGSAVQAHLQKAMALPELKVHLEQGNRFQVWGWRETWTKTGEKTKAVRWRPRIVSVVLRDGMLFHEEDEGLSANGQRPDSHSGYLAGSSPASPTTAGGEHERSSARSFKSVTEGSIPSAPTSPLDTGLVKLYKTLSEESVDGGGDATRNASSQESNQSRKFDSADSTDLSTPAPADAATLAGALPLFSEEIK
jgi:hypothetical protein